MPALTDPPSQLLLNTSSHQETIKDLEHKLSADPTSISSWLALLSQTLLTAPLTSKNAIKTRADITLSIISRALSAHSNNSSSKILRLKYLRAGEEVWHESKLRAEWEVALKVGGVDLGIEWLDWRIGRAINGIDGVLEDARRIMETLGHEEEDEIGKVRIFWRAAVAFHNAGASLCRKSAFVSLYAACRIH